MHRIDAADHVGNRFSDGDSTVGIPGTTEDAAWANAVQESICQAIEAAGIVLAKGDDTQLTAAIRALATAIVGSHNGAAGVHAAASSSEAVAGRLVLRDAAGRAKFAPPLEADHAATLAFVNSGQGSTVFQGKPTASDTAPGDSGFTLATKNYVDGHPAIFQWTDLGYEAGFSGGVRAMVRHGEVILRGQWYRASGSGMSPFVLPAGMRPLADMFVLCPVFDGSMTHDGAAYRGLMPVTIDNFTGAVLAASAITNGYWVSMDGIRIALH